MNKIVNIYPKNAVLTVNPPIRSVVRRVTKSTSEIRACIIARAIVEEVLPDGNTIRLDFSNYDKDNTPSKVEKAIAKAEEKQAVEIPTVETTEIKTDNINIPKVSETRYTERNNNNKKYKNQNKYHSFKKESGNASKIESVKDANQTKPIEASKEVESVIETIDAESI